MSLHEEFESGIIVMIQMTSTIFVMISPEIVKILEEACMEDTAELLHALHYRSTVSLGMMWVLCAQSMPSKVIDPALLGPGPG